MNFSDAELERYARHIVLPEIGGAGQAALKAARVLVVGAGGIGSPALQYLAAAGVGNLFVIDHDQIDLSNLQRQTLFGSDEVGGSKAAVAVEALERLNPDIRPGGFSVRLNADNIAEIFELTQPQVILDGTDNFETRLLVADAALRHRVPLVSAAVGRFEGQLGVFRGWEADKPCYRCFVGNDPETAGINCSEQGVLGALTGIMGSLAALEVIRAIHPFGEDSAGKLLLADTLALRFRTLTLPKDPGCPVCTGVR